MIRKINITFLIFTICLNFGFAYSYFQIPTWDNNLGTTEVNAEATAENFLNIESESAILIEQTTGNILYEKNSHTQLRPASVTKIMTVLLIMEAIDNGELSMQDKVSCSEKASNMGGSQIWLDTKERLTVQEMLKAICVVSANDCAVAMAEHLAGSEELFVNKMNEKAKELGMNDTTFKNCHGIDEDGHITSSYDISLMSRELLSKHPSITEFTTIWMDSLRDNKSELVNTNKLIRTYDGATGLKTGSTSLALYNLSASATRDNLSLIAVVLRAPTSKLRFSEAKLLLDYGFSTYKFENFCKKDEVFESVPVYKGTEASVNLVFENDSGALIKKTENTSNIKQELIINENITAPINKGDVLGKINYYSENNTLLSSVNLISEKDVTKINIINMFNSNLSSWFTLFRK